MGLDGQELKTLRKRSSLTPFLAVAAGAVIQAHAFVLGVAGSGYAAYQWAERTQQACGVVTRFHTLDLISSPQRVYFGVSGGYHETALFPHPGEARTAFMSTRFNGFSFIPQLRIGELGFSLLVIGGSATGRYNEVYNPDPLPRKHVAFYARCAGFPQNRR